MTIRKAPGKASALSAAMLAKLQKRLDDPYGFASYGEIQRYRAAEQHVHLSDSTLHALVDRYQGERL